MKASPNKILKRLTTMLKAWQSIRPNEIFAGMTLEQFRAAVDPSLASRRRIADHLAQVRAGIAERESADKRTRSLLLRVVAGVRAHEGENGEMYKTLGYVLANERKSGLTPSSTGAGSPTLTRRTRRGVGRQTPRYSRLPRRSVSRHGASTGSFD